MAVAARGWWAAVGVAALLALVPAAAPQAQQTGPAVTEQERALLLGVAREVLANRALALVDRAVPATATTLAAGAVPRSPQLAAAEVQGLRALTARRDQLRTAGEIYEARETEVRLESVRATGDLVRLTVVELTSLYRATVRGDEPERTAFQVWRAFDFTSGDRGWTLVGQELLDGGLPPLTEPPPVVADNAPLTPFGGFAEIT